MYISEPSRELPKWNVNDGKKRGEFCCHGILEKRLNNVNLEAVKANLIPGEEEFIEFSV